MTTVTLRSRRLSLRDSFAAVERFAAEGRRAPVAQAVIEDRR